MCNKWVAVADGLPHGVRATDPNNRLATDGTFIYEYDAEGNRISRTRTSNDPADDYLTEYEWDHHNR